jgi:hypothetical protein
LKLVKNLVRRLESNEKLAKMILISKRWIDACKLKHKLDLEGKETISNLAYLVVRMGYSYTSFLRGIEWRSLVMAINSTKLE